MSFYIELYNSLNNPDTSIAKIVLGEKIGEKFIFSKNQLIYSTLSHIEKDLLLILKEGIKTPKPLLIKYNKSSIFYEPLIIKTKSTINKVANNPPSLIKAKNNLSNLTLKKYMLEEILGASFENTTLALATVIRKNKTDRVALGEKLLIYEDGKTIGDMTDEDLKSKIKALALKVIKSGASTTKNIYITKENKETSKLLFSSFISVFIEPILPEIIE